MSSGDNYILAYTAGIIRMNSHNVLFTGLELVMHMQYLDKLHFS